MDWKFAQENVMYIRIDGDIVYMEDQTIPTIIKTKLESPSENLMVSANVVNEGALASLHSHAGVALPYLPELSTHTKQPSREKSQLKHDWRASALPAWFGPEDFKVQRGFKAPFDGHRWLLPRGRGSASTSPSQSTSTSTSSISGAESGNLNNDRDPISASMFTDTGPSVHDWTVGAQQHYSFLHHLELGDLNRYKFPLWVNPTEPVSTNFGCFWGKDVRALRDVFGFKSDEEIYKSWTGSDEDRPNVTIDGKGVASHYSSKQGVEGLDETDLLERYRAYALERVCRRETGMRSGMKKSLEVD